MKQVYEDQYCTMTVDSENNLWLNWNVQSANMTGEDFKKVLLENARLLGEIKTATNVVDILEFLGPMGPELMEWRAKELFPKYIANGLKKQAFYNPKQAPSMSSDGTNTGGVLIEGFSNKSEMLAWLN